MSLNIERLREAVAWAEFEAKKGREGKWYQELWATGKKGRARRPKAILSSRGTKMELEEESHLREVKCLTAFCVAGHICNDAGDKFVAFDWGFDDDDEGSADYVIPKGSRNAMYISARAAELLGITEKEANDLFDGQNSIHRIRLVARRIAKKYGETL